MNKKGCSVVVETHDVEHAVKIYNFLCAALRVSAAGAKLTLFHDGEEVASYFFIDEVE